MNVAFFMKPKADITYLYSDFTVRQALEKMHNTSYTAVPVIDRDGKYLGTINEGDLLWFIVQGEGGEPHTMAIESLEKFKVNQIDLNKKKHASPLAHITDSVEDLIASTMTANFVPIVDDRGLFIGIVTRSAIIKYYYDTYVMSGKTPLDRDN